MPTNDSSYRSNPHRRLEKTLTKMGISFLSEHAEFPPYTLDLYLPDFHLCIEVDGPKHSSKKDAARDDWMLERFGIPTLRIKPKGPWLGNNKLEEKILEFLNQHVETYKERRQRLFYLYAR